MQPSELSVVGMGQGQLDQLTLNGLALIRDADIIIYDGDDEIGIEASWFSHKRCLVHRPRYDFESKELRPGAAEDGARSWQRPLSGQAESRQRLKYDLATVEAECRQVAEWIRSGSKVVRLCLQQAEPQKRLERELTFLRRLGVRIRFVPSLQALHDEAWNLGLPWLAEAHRGNFRVIPSTQVRGDRNFWRYLADEAQTLALDVGRGRLETFIERLLLAGADPERPVALVAHHPTKSPICWLTTLEEVDELLPQWKPNGATILYIGTWPHAIRDTEANQSFWGSLEAAAEVWLRAQRA